jgi:hypothetical protein
MKIDKKVINMVDSQKPIHLTQGIIDQLFVDCLQLL